MDGGYYVMTGVLLPSNSRIGKKAVRRTPEDSEVSEGGQPHISAALIGCSSAA